MITIITTIMISIVITDNNKTILKPITLNHRSEPILHTRSNCKINPINIQHNNNRQQMHENMMDAQY